TLAYMLHRLPHDRKIVGQVFDKPAVRAAQRRLVEIPAGLATLGQTGTADESFGWDNERGALEVDVPCFAIESHNITNGDFLRFVQAHGYQNRSLWSADDWDWKEKEGIGHPAFWHHEGNIWMYRAMFGEIRLPLEWPVYVSHAEATAYANWLGRRLP